MWSSKQRVQRVKFKSTGKRRGPSGQPGGPVSKIYTLKSSQATFVSINSNFGPLSILVDSGAEISVIVANNLNLNESNLNKNNKCQHKITNELKSVQESKLEKFLLGTSLLVFYALSISSIPVFSFLTIVMCY